MSTVSTCSMVRGIEHVQNVLSYLIGSMLYTLHLLGDVTFSANSLQHVLRACVSCHAIIMRANKNSVERQSKGHSKSWQ